MDDQVRVAAQRHTATLKVQTSDEVLAAWSERYVAAVGVLIMDVEKRLKAIIHPEFKLPVSMGTVNDHRDKPSSITWTVDRIEYQVQPGLVGNGVSLWVRASHEKDWGDAFHLSSTSEARDWLVLLQRIRDVGGEVARYKREKKAQFSQPQLGDFDLKPEMQFMGFGGQFITWKIGPFYLEMIFTDGAGTACVLALPILWGEDRLSMRNVIGKLDDMIVGEVAFFGSVIINQGRDGLESWTMTAPCAPVDEAPLCSTTVQFRRMEKDKGEITPCLAFNTHLVRLQKYYLAIRDWVEGYADQEGMRTDLAAEQLDGGPYAHVTR